MADGSTLPLAGHAGGTDDRAHAGAAKGEWCEDVSASSRSGCATRCDSRRGLVALRSVWPSVDQTTNDKWPQTRPRHHAQTPVRSGARGSYAAVPSCRRGYWDAPLGFAFAVAFRFAQNRRIPALMRLRASADIWRRGRSPNGAPGWCLSSGNALRMS